MATLNIAHRGGRGLEPENTLRAFSRAGGYGADGIEFDVQRTLDGKPVVFHDSDLERITGAKGLLKDITFRDLRKLDAGGGERVPLLEKTLKLISGHNLMLIIELKNPEIYPGIEEQVCGLITRYYDPDLVRVASFSAESLEIFKSLAPSIRLVRNYRFNMPAISEFYGTASVDARSLLFFPWRINVFRKHCRELFVWSVKDRGQMRRFIKAGIDGIITDYPDRLKEILDEK